MTEKEEELQELKEEELQELYVKEIEVAVAMQDFMYELEDFLKKYNVPNTVTLLKGKLEDFRDQAIDILNLVA